MSSIGACRLCPVGTYSTVSGATSCLPCPDNKDTTIRFHCPQGCVAPEQISTANQTFVVQQSVFTVESEDSPAEEVLIRTLFYDTTQGYAPAVYGYMLTIYSISHV